MGGALGCGDILAGGALLAVDFAVANILAFPSVSLICYCLGGGRKRRKGCRLNVRFLPWASAQFPKSFPAFPPLFLSCQVSAFSPANFRIEC